MSKTLLIASVALTVISTHVAVFALGTLQPAAKADRQSEAPGPAVESPSLASTLSWGTVPLAGGGEAIVVFKDVPNAMERDAAPDALKLRPDGKITSMAIYGVTDGALELKSTRYIDYDLSYYQHGKKASGSSVTDMKKTWDDTWKDVSRRAPSGGAGTR